ncbi:hypothetical protein SAMN05421759_1144 [Roseivivax lentus]|uniref:Uncharacterized protein n=1 Tax=Roseivivax lentus TaxID=633194 RepID=A0A1N7PA39_9RHOB|nr:hypothetical protein [Roseivivax lentus]SIT07387.1 hypothetical protein SAMN05421759_1144 [Roseivivax lentus]
MDLLTAQTQEITGVSIFPYYRDVPLELDAVAHGASGRYETGFFAGQSYHRLTLDDVRITRALHVGATYSCTARGPDDRPLKTHWLFCTSLAPRLSFGLSKGWGAPAGCTAILPDIDGLLVELEELTDLVSVFPSPLVENSVCEAQIGRKGWLVMTRIGCPQRIGILVEDPVLPSSMCLGSTGITMAARAVRTTQAISLGPLSCVRDGDAALFLRMEA